MISQTCHTIRSEAFLPLKSFSSIYCILGGALSNREGGGSLGPPVTPLYELSDTNEIRMVDEGEDMNIVDGHGRRGCQAS